MRLLLPCVLGVVLTLVAPARSTAQAQFSFDWPAIATRLVAQLAPQPGEKLLILTHPGLFEDLIPHLRYAIARAGATDVGVVDVLAEPVPAGWDFEQVRRGNARAREAYRAMFAGVDGAIMMPGAVPAHPAYAALQDLLREGRGRTVHFHWVENGSAFPLPGQPLPSRAAIDALYQRALLDTDYAAVAGVLQRFEQALRTGEVHVTSPSGTNLRFRVGSRVVNRQDGDASAARTARGQVLIDREIELPAGVARVAPLEDSVEGTIAFPPSQWDARAVEGLRLHFERGQVVFKAEVGSQSPSVGQIQGVWVHPDWRGRGLGTAGTAALASAVVRSGRTASLYVNSFNIVARATYARIGFTQIGTFATVLLD